MDTLYIKCPKCKYKPTTKDYDCPKCNVKFRPISVFVISGIFFLFGLLSLNILFIIFSIGLFLMKQWARKWFILVIFGTIIFSIVLFIMVPNSIYEIKNIANLALLLAVPLPLAIYLITNKEILEAFEFYSGRY
jgi:hypothetical protein